MDNVLARDRRCGAAVSTPTGNPSPRARLRAGATAVLTALLLPWAAWAESASPREASAAGGEPETPIVIEERLTVTDTRLRGEIKIAADLLEELVLSEDFAEFLTLPAYDVVTRELKRPMRLTEFEDG